MQGLRERIFKLLYVRNYIKTHEKPLSPRRLLGSIFDVVQLSRAFSDSKTFVDAVPKKRIPKIQNDYKKMYGTQLDLNRFVRENFILPEPAGNITQTKTQEEIPIREHITKMWRALERDSDIFVKKSSLLALPFSYIVPGGRFREIYYWDSYFTMLGLREEGEIDLIESMVKNFAFLIDTYGFIANGNRSYYLTRSQPPVFALMVEMLAEIKGESVYADFQPQIIKEYTYWMRGMKSSAFTNKTTNSSEHVVRMPDGEILNRYWDESISPREESFIEDVEVGKSIDESSTFYRNMRAGAESGWDFSSRWFMDVHDKTSIRTTDLVPIDLNILLLRMEEIIEHTYNLQQKARSAEKYSNLANKRRDAIRKYLWNENNTWYCDFIISESKIADQPTIAGAFALYGGVANTQQADAMSIKIRNEFLKTGGVATTLVNSGEQWDAPNGWAPMQYICITGLERHGNHMLAEEIAKRWCTLNIETYQRTGFLFEKYDIENPLVIAHGGEYTVQTGFGWTNGVLLNLLNKYHLE